MYIIHTYFVRMSYTSGYMCNSTYIISVDCYNYMCLYSISFISSFMCDIPDSMPISPMPIKTV